MMSGEPVDYGPAPEGEAPSHLELWRSPDGKGLVCRIVFQRRDEFLTFDDTKLTDVIAGLRMHADRIEGDDERAAPKAESRRSDSDEPPAERRPGWQGESNGPKGQTARPKRRAPARPVWVEEIEGVMADAGWPPAVGE